MIKQGNIQAVYFLGIGGIGMSSLARYFQGMGLLVAGYDKTPSPLIQSLQTSGIEVVFDDSLEGIPTSIKAIEPNRVLWVYTPAIPANHPQFVDLKNQGIAWKKRAEVLGLITQDKYTLAVAGTHGKTTTSTLLAHLLITGGIDCSAFLGGISGNYETNYIECKNPKDSVVVVEADEFDRSFLRLHPNAAIITSADPDHLDIYHNVNDFLEGFANFAALVPKNGILVQQKRLQFKSDSLSETYAAEGPADYFASKRWIENGAYCFDFMAKGRLIPALRLGLAGKHNMENAIAASALALHMGVSDEDLRKGLATFKGVKRRFEYVVKGEQQVYIDDYAHHPQELSACILSVRELYPGQEICGIFQPHLFSRTRDFMDGFVDSLKLLDRCILMPIYPAREEPIAGVNSNLLKEKIGDKALLIENPADVVEWVKRNKPSLLLTLGAGDIDRIVPQLKEVLE